MRRLEEEDLAGKWSWTRPREALWPSRPPLRDESVNAEAGGKVGWERLPLALARRVRREAQVLVGRMGLELLRESSKIGDSIWTGHSRSKEAGQLSS